MKAAHYRNQKPENSSLKIHNQLEIWKFYLLKIAEYASVSRLQLQKPFHKTCSRTCQENEISKHYSCVQEIGISF